MTDISTSARLAVDVGGTFTDVALEFGEQRVTTKVLTTPSAPEQGVLSGVEKALEEAGIAASEVGLLIHGTTLATNALIERKGAKTALITTEGFRDSVEMALENRFEQYDINIDRPDPLVPRHLRWPVTERMNHKGEVLLELDEESVRALFALIRKHEIEAIAVGLLHCYANPAHEQRVGEILAAEFPDLSISLSSDVCPEIREYDRQSTTCANAYVRPKMSSYLLSLDKEMKSRGLNCAFLLMTSGGGLTTLDNAVAYPIRLVESGPAGGAILAAVIAKECGIPNVLSYDMGGTTAKVCMIDDYQTLSSRTFEVARVYRNLRGSGLPVRIPAIEMVEIGAGGGSIAGVDAMGRIAVGPESAGADPGPASYDQGGTRPTVTDADVVLGKIDPALFAGGSVSMAPKKAEGAIMSEIGEKLSLELDLAAYGIAEIVDENMANAARVHAIEWGKEISERAMIAFGGAAPLHAARLAEKLDIDTVIVPTGAGVGSAIGFLRAPISYEVVRSRYLRLSEFDPNWVNPILNEMSAEASAVVRVGAGPDAVLDEVRVAYMRYVGQGHEITISLPNRPLEAGDGETLRQTFEEEYARLYGRAIPGQEPEILSWTLTATAPFSDFVGKAEAVAPADAPAPNATRRIFDTGSSKAVEASVWRRDDLPIGSSISGPAIIEEAQTTTIVSPSFEASINGLGYIVLNKKAG
ncbi:MAG: hydantoinase/oxoprolinase family protein [Rhodospirillaceae bacterium]|jgi:N-methylhydantoinase A|nr:hydantoinase/oxoprolinase family protein [Rhodospirillaceae bacterium]MBT6137514.1 hydantoinase/oxoprolinase family protein [Rhodospirillaceae bacterium]